MTKLKPCPFCGGEAEMQKLFGAYHVQCKACRTYTLLLTKEHDAAEKWNRRQESEPLNELAAKIHANAVAHGWWDKERSFGDTISLCHSELSEALEEDRNGRPMLYYNCDGHICDENACDNCETRNERVDKPEGIAVEMLDCVIRILDWCGKEKVDVDRLLQVKHEYNVTRPHKHGGKKY